MEQLSTIEYLIQHGVKPSVQRIAIMEYLQTHCTHPTVDEIFHNLAPTIPTLSRTTVYNTLKLLVDKGAVQMLTIDEKNLCFDGNITPHSHFLCAQCGKVYDFSIKTSIEEVAKDLPIGFEVKEVHQYYRGICKTCNNNNNNINFK